MSGNGTNIGIVEGRRSGMRCERLSNRRIGKSQSWRRHASMQHSSLARSHSSTTTTPAGSGSVSPSSMAGRPSNANWM